MIQLSELQLEFQDYVLNGTPAVAKRIESGAGPDPSRRLSVYYDAYRLRLIDALAADYEALRALLGIEEFATACRNYVADTPSVHRNLRWYGEGLPTFLRITPPWSLRPEVHELAGFEWTLTLAFDAPDVPVVRFQNLAQIPPHAWPALRFSFQPALRIMELSTNAPALRKAADEGGTLPRSVVSDRVTPWLIWRKDLTVCFRSLSEPEHWALLAVQNGDHFACLCEGLCQWYRPEEAAPQAAQLVRLWIDDELIADLAVPADA